VTYVGAALVAAWLALQPHSSDEYEDPTARAHRVETIAAAVVAETDDDLEAALVAATIEHEGEHLSRRVHEGRQLGDHGRAYCLGQVHAQRWLPRDELVRTVGTDLESTRRCVRAVVVVYRMIPCTLRGKINSYATGRGCRAEWSGATERERRTYYYLERIKAERAAGATRKRNA
jgi:hypothetical protein